MHTSSKMEHGFGDQLERALDRAIWELDEDGTKKTLWRHGNASLATVPVPDSNKAKHSCNGPE